MTEVIQDAGSLFGKMTKNEKQIQILALENL